MARKKRMYSRRRRINYKGIFLLLAVIIVLIALLLNIFKKDSYISKIEEALESDIVQILGTLSTVTKIDATIYENDGIKYTNQHEGIKKIKTFDGTDQEKVKLLFKNLLKSQETEIVDNPKDIEEGYYWIEADIISKNKVLFFTKEKEYNFDFYYDIENNRVYVKEKYFDEFNKRYNKTKFQCLSVTDEFKNIIVEMTDTNN
ncbi:MAG TPA: hypothetical protein GX396_07710 [Tissierellia bacterium]|mgnify:CR=1 FL=1|nr:hypothetical protein [Tissierellia bacterium]